MKQKIGYFLLIIFILGIVIYASKIIPERQLPKVIEVGPHKKTFVLEYRIVEIPKTDITFFSDYYFELENEATGEIIQSSIVAPEIGETFPNYVVINLPEGSYIVLERDVYIYSVNPATITVTMGAATSVLTIFGDVFLYMMIGSIGVGILNKIFKLL